MGAMMTLPNGAGEAGGRVGGEGERESARKMGWPEIPGCLNTFMFAASDDRPPSPHPRPPAQSAVPTGQDYRSMGPPPPRCSPSDLRSLAVSVTPR